MNVKDNAHIAVQFTKFFLIGAVGFLFDGSCFWLLLQLGGAPSLARALSITLALVLSWWLNRNFTFQAGQDRQRWTEMSKFVLSQLPGAGVNVVVSLLAFHYVSRHSDFFSAAAISWLATLVGGGSGLVLNFFMARVFVFNHL
jgi:putative flippase GtrA